MNDEEREAVEYWKTHMKILHLNTQLASEHYIKVLLDLVEKQSKEIEELKEKDDANLAYYDQIYQNGIYTGQKAVEDKIKAKIEDILNSENSEAIQKLIEWQSLLEKE